MKTSPRTNATKKRATTLEDFISRCCIQDFLTAILSAKWLPAERMPIKSSTGPFGRGAACHLLDISRCLWGAKLGWDDGKEAANREWTSMSPFNVSPVASSSEKPWKHRKNHIIQSTKADDLKRITRKYSLFDKERMWNASHLHWHGNLPNQHWGS